MSKDVTFSLDPAGGADILQNMAMPLIKQAGEAIAARAQSMAGSLSSDPPEITVSTAVGTIKRGQRAISTVRATPKNAHQAYIATVALAKSRDAGRV